MKNAFNSPEQVETFLFERGIRFRKGYCNQPLKGKNVVFYQVKVGKTFCDVYDIVTWANTVHNR